MKKHVLSNYNFPYSLYTNGDVIKKEAKNLKPNEHLPAMKDGPRYGKNKHLKIVYDKEAKILLRVFRGMLNVSHRQLTDCKLIVDDIEHQNEYALLVAYDRLYDLYYIAYDQIEYHVKRGHYLNIKYRISAQGSEYLQGSFDDFLPFSELSILGYKVGYHGLSEEKRHMIIRHVLENRIMDGYEVIEFLQSFIALRKNQNQKDFSKSIEDWKNDLDFVYENFPKIFEH